MGVKWTPGPWQIRSTVDPMTNPTERNLERVRGICDAWRNAGQPWGETRNEAEDIHKRYEPRFVIVYALAMDELEREAEARGRAEVGVQRTKSSAAGCWWSSSNQVGHSAMKPPADMTIPELNAAIAVEVMGWTKGPHPDNNLLDMALEVWWHTTDAAEGWHYQVDDWSPATDIAAAMNDVVPEMIKRGYCWSLITGEPKYEEWAWCVDLNDGIKAKDIFNDSLPRAICEAALEAVRNV